MTKAQAIRLLRTGRVKTHDDLILLGAKQLGSGFYRTAYRLGGVVIKRRQSNRRPVRRIRLAKARGFYIAPTTYCGAWEIQDYYRPLTERQIKMFHTLKGWLDWSPVDDHEGNIGFDKDGNLYIFDV